jgi:prepilin-type N-terminal cleavage/methylation domain-containing protein
MMFYQNKQSGFSLVETLVAISILLIVIVGPMSISMRSAKSSSFASEQIQAFFLAQEGLELAQKVRDDILLNYINFGGTNATPWAQFSNTLGTYADCFNSNGCGLQWHTSTAGALAVPVSCATVSNCLLHRSTAGRAWFTHTSGGANVATPFTRRIYFTTGTTGDEVQVRSVVTWRTGSIVAEQRVEVDTYLYNIYGTP